MKLRIEVEEMLKDDEIVIRCRAITPEIMQLQTRLQKEQSLFSHFVAQRGETEYYLDFAFSSFIINDWIFHYFS